MKNTKRMLCLVLAILTVFVGGVNAFAIVDVPDAVPTDTPSTLYTDMGDTDFEDNESVEELPFIDSEGRTYEEKLRVMNAQYPYLLAYEQYVEKYGDNMPLIL
jgi:hypothetical protein